MKTIKIPYDKKTEIEERKKFWKYSHRSWLYPSCAIPISSLTYKDDGKETPFELSDNGKEEKIIYQSLEVEILLNDLSPKERGAVQLKTEGYSQNQIAKELDIKKNAAKQLIFRGYKRIKSNYPKVN